MTRKVLIEVEVPEGRSLEEILKGVKYRVLGYVENSVEDDRVGAMDWEGPASYRECGGRGEG